MTRYWRDGAWMNCSWCGGYGMVTGCGGDPADCWHCDGSGAERARDEKGRYTKFPPLSQPPVPPPNKALAITPRDRSNG